MNHTDDKLKVVDGLIKSGKYLEAGDNLFKYLSRLSPNKKDLIEFWSQAHEAHKIRNTKIIKFHRIISQKINEIYGLNHKEHDIKNLIETDRKSSIDFYDISKKHKISVKLNKSQVLKRWIELQNRFLLPTFTKRMGYSESLIEKIDESLSKNDREFAVWLLMDFYPNYLNGEYDNVSVSKISEQAYGVHFYVVEDYSPLEYM